MRHFFNIFVCLKVEHNSCREFLFFRNLGRIRCFRALPIRIAQNDCRSICTYICFKIIQRAITSAQLLGWVKRVVIPCCIRVDVICSSVSNKSCILVLHEFSGNLKSILKYFQNKDKRKRATKTNFQSIKTLSFAKFEVYT